MKLNKVVRVVSAALGELPLAADSTTFKPSMMKKEDKLAEVAENIGYTESPQPAELSMTVNATMDPSDFDLSEDTLTIYLSGGAVHQMANIWITDQVELSKGEIKVTAHSAKSQKVS
jgi:hypothetical protein